MTIFYCRTRGGNNFHPPYTPNCSRGKHKCIKHRYILLGVANYSSDVRRGLQMCVHKHEIELQTPRSASKVVHSSNLISPSPTPWTLIRTVIWWWPSASLHSCCISAAGSLKRVRLTCSRWGRRWAPRATRACHTWNDGATKHLHQVVRTEHRPCSWLSGSWPWSAYRATYHRTHLVPAVCRRTTR